MWDVHPGRLGPSAFCTPPGLDPWVIDFGSPDWVEGATRRTQIVALSEALDLTAEITGQDYTWLDPRRAECSATPPPLPAFEEHRQYL